MSFAFIDEIAYSSNDDPVLQIKMRRDSARLKLLEWMDEHGGLSPAEGLELNKLKVARQFANS